MNIIDILFPKICVGCGKVGTYLCSNCQKQINQTDLVCPNCERPSVGGITHPLCIKKYGLDGLWSLGVYQGPLKKIIQNLKYRFAYDTAESLVNLLVDYWSRYTPLLIEKIQKTGAKDWLVIPVPLYQTRQNWRGFNQASLLGRLLAQKLDLKYGELLTRVKSTKQQVGLSAWQRKQNIYNAFALSMSRNRASCLTTMNHELLTMNILLIDDVWTTGSTIKECCQVLKKAGVKSVWALTFAR